ncbi:unnamed protein product [Linum tenue]|uniref:S-protein homolog n=1 Tax=Linum tenue TaxID=586396 RepID=A0AAV0K6W3_9ROSI|nr:unnamed protein product [Linum tenue]
MAHPSTQQAVTKLHVKNELCGLRLIVHCASKDDDLRAHVLDTGSAFSWEFESVNFIRTTVFWCNLAVRDNRLSFTAYNAAIRNRREHWVVNEKGVFTVGHHLISEWRYGALSVDKSHCNVGP